MPPDSNWWFSNKPATILAKPKHCHSMYGPIGFSPHCSWNLELQAIGLAPFPKLDTELTSAIFWVCWINPQKSIFNAEVKPYHLRMGIIARFCMVVNLSNKTCNMLQHTMYRLIGFIRMFYTNDLNFIKLMHSVQSFTSAPKDPASRRKQDYIHKIVRAIVFFTI